jgi:RNA polymerase sigma-70 factor (ECF subfamily)
MSVTEQGWQDRLVKNGPGCEEAVTELRSFLLKGVRSGLSGRAGSDDGFVEDVVQSALVRILDNIHTFKGKSALTTWALAIALRVAFTELRRKHWGNVSLDELRETSGNVNEEADPLPDPHRSAACNSLISVVHRLIRTELTERQRDALLAELRSMPQDEMARQMGVSRNAIYKLTHDARKALKGALATEGYGIEQVREVFD